MIRFYASALAALGSERDGKDIVVRAEDADCGIVGKESSLASIRFMGELAERAVDELPAGALFQCRGIVRDGELLALAFQAEEEAE